MWSDFDSQTNYVIKNAWRLLSFQDKEISSPSYGSFHYAYWRDKTSEFADSRFQEAGATIGILSTNKYAKFHGKTLPSKDELSTTMSLPGEPFRKPKLVSYGLWIKGHITYAANNMDHIHSGHAKDYFPRSKYEKED